MADWFIKCSCGSEALYIEEDTEDNDIYISFWRQGNKNRGWINKIKLIWYILRWGTTYSDMIILDEEGQDEVLEIIAEKRMRDTTNDEPATGLN